MSLLRRRAREFRGGFGLRQASFDQLGFGTCQRGLRIEGRVNLDGEIEEQAGNYGAFTPYSWWPLWLSLAGSLVFLGVAVGLWVSAFGALVGVWALCGWVFEYYKGEHAH